MTPKPHIITTSPENWCISATDAISTAVKSNINTKGECSLMLIGGNTAKHLYQRWADTSPWDQSKIKYLLGDERCVPSDHHESNYGIVRRTLFLTGIPDGCELIRMEGEM